MRFPHCRCSQALSPPELQHRLGTPRRSWAPHLPGRAPPCPPGAAVEPHRPLCAGALSQTPRAQPNSKRKLCFISPGEFRKVIGAGSHAGTSPSKRHHHLNTGAAEAEQVKRPFKSLDQMLFPPCIAQKSLSPLSELFRLQGNKRLPKGTGNSSSSPSRPPTHAAVCTAPSKS